LVPYLSWEIQNFGQPCKENSDRWKLLYRLWQELAPCLSYSPSPHLFLFSFFSFYFLFIFCFFSLELEMCFCVCVCVCLIHKKNIIKNFNTAIQTNVAELTNHNIAELNSKNSIAKTQPKKYKIKNRKTQNWEPKNLQFTTLKTQNWKF
jgi:hypothetical protein